MSAPRLRPSSSGPAGEARGDVKGGDRSSTPSSGAAGLRGAPSSSSSSSSTSSSSSSAPTAPSPTPVEPADLAFYLGCRLRIETNRGDVFEGDLFEVTETPPVAVIKTVTTPAGIPGVEPKSTIQFINTTCVLRVQVLGRDPTARPVDSPLPAPDLTRVEAMRVRVEAELRAEIEKLNVSAPAEGQALFTQLSKQYRCGWDDVHIVIDDFAILRAPYGLENVEKLPGSRATDEALARIRKVIAVAWTKIGRSLAAPGK